jgi:hypothetical protein
MKGKMVVFLLFVLFSLDLHAQQLQEKLYGSWLWRERSNAVVEFFKDVDGTIAGKVISADDKDMIGRIVFYRITSDKTTDHFKGRGDAPIGAIDIFISFASEDSLKVVGKKMFVSKTFLLVRVRKKG